MLTLLEQTRISSMIILSLHIMVTGVESRRIRCFISAYSSNYYFRKDCIIEVYNDGAFAGPKGRTSYVFFYPLGIKKASFS